MLARAVATVHTGYVLFVLLGSLLVLLWPSLLWVHLAAVTWAGATMLFDLGCPLTPWEKQFWKRGGREPYEEGFLQHHVLRMKFDPAHARRNHALIGVFVVTLNLVIYFIVFGHG
jgi:hypothetical protein